MTYDEMVSFAITMVSELDRLMGQAVEMAEDAEEREMDFTAIYHRRMAEIYSIQYDALESWLDD